MKTSVLQKRFDELLTQWEQIEGAKVHQQGTFPGYRVNPESLLNWRVKARNLLVKACQKDSEHYLQFVETEKPQAYRLNYEELNQLGAVFRAAKEDYEGGYLASVRQLVQSEVFDSELDQARELLTSGYDAPAAVIAGTVLETTLRQLCIDRGIEIGKLDRMNSALAKDSCYHLLVQKRITAIADIRNSAAHGNKGKFKPTDVADMIEYIEQFVSEHL